MIATSVPAALTSVPCSRDLRPWRRDLRPCARHSGCYQAIWCFRRQLTEDAQMPRKPRVLEPNRVYHVYNRWTDRQRLFPSPRAYDEFVDLLETGVQRYGVRICSYCPLETHWDQAIWVRQDDGAAAVSKYLRWLSSCHALRFRFTTQTRGQGHVYQDRYKAHPVHDDRHYVTLVRYIEANPVVAGLVERAEQWPWSSFAERMSGSR